MEDIYAKVAVMAKRVARWYQDPQLLKAAYEEHGSFDLVAEKIGGADRTTLCRWWKRHNLGSLSFGPEPKSKVNNAALERLAQKVYGNQS